MPKTKKRATAKQQAAREHMKRAAAAVRQGQYPTMAIAMSAVP